MYMWGGGGSLHVVDAEGVQSVGDWPTKKVEVGDRNFCFGKRNVKCGWML